MAYKLAAAGLYFHVNMILDMPEEKVKLVAIADRRQEKDSLVSRNFKVVRA